MHPGASSNDKRVNELEEITLQGMLPRVFVNERIPASEVWSTTLHFRRGEHYLVEAVSGGGKSSMCAYIYGSRDDYEGKLLFNGEDVRRMSMEEWQALRRTSLAYLPQQLDLFPELSDL